MAQPRRWLLLVHQLPARPSNLRVRTWRRLQQFGALPVKQALYVLPDTPECREDFEWLKAEIDGAGGQASVFSADHVDTWSDDALVDEFRRSRETAYAALARDAERVARRLSAPSRTAKAPIPPRAVQRLRERLAAVERVDFFGSAGRDRVATLLRQIEDRAAPGSRGAASDTPAAAPAEYRGRLWVTRHRPGVDRMASAWLIRRFIDAGARFGFVADREQVPKNAVPFDMFEVEFTHVGDLCTFEMLSERFALAELAVSRIAAIVHDLDLKDARFGAPESPTVGVVIEGLRLGHSDDQALLDAGITLFEALYQAFSYADRPARPRPVARRRGAAKRLRTPSRRTK